MSKLKIYKKSDILRGHWFTEYCRKDEADAYIAELEESHKKEVEQLLMKISGLEKLVETADKIIKQKGGFTLKDVTFKDVKLEGVKNDRND